MAYVTSTLLLNYQQQNMQTVIDIEGGFTDIHFESSVCGLHLKTVSKAKYKFIFKSNFGLSLKALESKSSW